MQLQKLVLNNIRSYTHEEIEFPKGSVLLSGDIGSGKSSLLLAIEFAIFGTMRTQLDGSALLRHGQTEGYVELTCNINDEQITIRRALKKTTRGIGQDSGFLIRNGSKEELTPVELKSRMLTLMGYPKELLTKSKSLIFRYTVYTPQEQMKAILFEDANERLNTLRRVFNIDKYKRIKENAQIYARILRERRKKLEGELVDYIKKKEQLDLINKQLKEAEEKALKLTPQLEVIRQELQNKLQAIKAIEEQVKQLLDLKKQVQILDTTIKYELQRKLDLEEDIKRNNSHLEILRKEFSAEKIPDHQTIITSIKETEKRLQQIQKERELASTQISEAGVHIGHATKVKKDLAKLDACPLCLQQVTDQHKNDVIEKEDGKIKQHASDQIVLQKKITELETKTAGLTNDLTHLREKEREASVFTVKQAALREKEQHVTSLTQKLPLIKEKIEQSQKNKQEVYKASFQLENSEQDHKVLKQDIEKTQKQEQDLAIQLAKAQKEKESIQNVLKNLQQELNQKEQAKKQLDKLTSLNHWLTDYFMKLMDQIEKHVLLSVYHQFNGLFQNWFSLLIEEETMQARLDDAFTPIIELNGYETDLQHLSGGEKTSCALAYRLALNKVINDLISTIHTRDLIILDEPTDGFSTEQLDRVREVLDELGIEQVILVSHEPKMESFVDSIIKVSKEQHESKITAL